MKELFPFYSIGHFINQPFNPTEFEATLFEEMEEPDVEEIHKHSFYEIIWIEEGTSRQTIDYKNYQLSPNSLFFISPGQIHEFEEWRPIAGGSIMFTEDFFLADRQNRDQLFERSFLDNFYANPYIKLHKKDFTEVKTIIDLMLNEQKRTDKSKTIIQSFLHVLMAQVQRYVDIKNEKSVPKRSLIIYKHFKNLLDKHFVENRTADFYAERLNITQHYLNTVIRDITGKTTTSVIRARSVLEAKRLLTFTDQTVSEIAAGLNYFDNSYFTKVFKMEAGTTPVAFKKITSEKYQKG